MSQAGGPAAWDAEMRARDEHRNETALVFHRDYATRIRDLLNECVEAGYSLEPELERFRVRGDAFRHDMQMAAEGVGIAGRRVRRDSKKL